MPVGPRAWPHNSSSIWFRQSRSWSRNTATGGWVPSEGVIGAASRSYFVGTRSAAVGHARWWPSPTPRSGSPAACMIFGPAGAGQRQPARGRNRPPLPGGRSRPRGHRGVDLRCDPVHVLPRPRPTGCRPASPGPSCGRLVPPARTPRRPPVRVRAGRASGTTLGRRHHVRPVPRPAPTATRDPKEIDLGLGTRFHHVPLGTAVHRRVGSPRPGRIAPDFRPPHQTGGPSRTPALARTRVAAGPCGCVGSPFVVLRPTQHVQHHQEP